MCIRTLIHTKRAGQAFCRGLRNGSRIGVGPDAERARVLPFGPRANNKMSTKPKLSFLAILVLLTHRRNIREEFAKIWIARELKGTPESAQNHPRP